MSYRAAIIYLWDLFDTGRAPGAAIVMATDALKTRADAVWAMHGKDAAPIWTKRELDEIVKFLTA